MTKKRFTETVSTGIVTDNVTGKEYNCEMRIDDELLEFLNKLSDENEQLKQYKQSVNDILLSWSQKNLTTKQLQIVIAIMEELNVMSDVE